MSINKDISKIVFRETFKKFNAIKYSKASLWNSVSGEPQKVYRMVELNVFGFKTLSFHWYWHSVLLTTLISVVVFLFEITASANYSHI